MYHLATLLPNLNRRRIPLRRDQVMLLIAAANEIFLGVDIYFAHLVSGTIVPREWIPIIFGPAAGVLLLIAGLIALKNRPAATIIANVVLIASMVVGVLGSYYHFIRAALPTAPASARLSLDLLVWAPPVLAPLTFAGVALLGISAAWIESPADSGILLVGKRRVRLPYSKTRAYLLMLTLAILVTLISSVFDHARSNFESAAVWVPTVVGVFAVIITLALAARDAPPSRGDLLVFAITMVVMILVGMLGLYFHINANLISEGTFVAERFLRGAPFMAPLLFCNMGMLGLAILLPPESGGA
jgi:hypothetical protein